MLHKIAGGVKAVVYTTGGRHIDRCGCGEVEYMGVRGATYEPVPPESARPPY